MKDKDLLKLLLKNGWTLKSINGSHHKLVKENYPPINLPIHGKDMKRGLEIRILKDAGLK